MHSNVLFFLCWLHRYNSAVHRGSDSCGKAVCSVQASGYHHIPEQARCRRPGVILALVSHLEHSTSLWLGKLPAGGSRHVVWTRLAESRFQKHVLHHLLFLTLLRCAICHHCGVIFMAALHAKTSITLSFWHFWCHLQMSWWSLVCCLQKYIHQVHFCQIGLSVLHQNGLFYFGKCLLLLHYILTCNVIFFTPLHFINT